MRLRHVARVKEGYRLRTAQWITVAALLLCGCDSRQSRDELLLETTGDINGRDPQQFRLTVDRRSLLQVTVSHSGIDLMMRLADSADRALGEFHSDTGRHGEERALFEVAASTTLVIAVAAPI